jgi:iron complex transport system permease protein
VGSLLASIGRRLSGPATKSAATPFTLGVSAGAALGAMLAITFSWSFAWAVLSAAVAASFLGSLAAVGIVYDSRAGGIAASRPTCSCSPA